MSNQLYQKGDRVTLAGLSTSKWNGKEGTIVSLLNTSNQSRYGVQVDGARKSVLIKPTHISPTIRIKENEGYDKNSVIDSNQVIRIGDRVALVGLKSLEHNGKQGIIVTLSDSSNEDRYGVRLDGGRKPVGIKSINMIRMCLERHIEDTNVAGDETAKIRMMMKNLSEEQQIHIFGRRIEPMPDFRLELIHEDGGYPLGVNTTWANDFLHQIFEQEAGYSMLAQLALEAYSSSVEKNDASSTV